MNNPLNNSKNDRLQIAEMFMAKADPKRCFFGIIKRWKDYKGMPFVFSKIVLPNNGFICAQEHDQKILGTMLDEMCIMILDMGLHLNAGITSEIFGEKYFLN